MTILTVNRYQNRQFFTVNRCVFLCINEFCNRRPKRQGNPGSSCPHILPVGIPGSCLERIYRPTKRWENDISESIPDRVSKRKKEIVNKSIFAYSPWKTFQNRFPVSFPKMHRARLFLLKKFFQVITKRNLKRWRLLSTPPTVLKTQGKDFF